MATVGWVGVFSITVRRRCIGPIVGLGFALFLAAPAHANQVYAVEGTDSFTIGARNMHGMVVYSGKETLSAAHRSDGTHYEVTVNYSRTEQGSRGRARATFISVVGPTGEQQDEFNGDPDYVAVLNQPFSIELDGATMRDVARLVAPVPFSFVLPLTGAPLTGSLRRGPDAYVAGQRTLQVVFEAQGPVHGPIGRAGVAVDGRIHMQGTAYYSYGTALLRALDTRLVISGRLTGTADHRPVTIVYRREIRAVAPSPLKEAAH